MNSSLTNLDPSEKEPRIAKEVENVPDLLEKVTLSQNTVQYGDHCSIESASCSGKQETLTQEKGDKPSTKEDVSKLRLTKLKHFSVRRPDDQTSLAVVDILALDNVLIIVDLYNKLKVFDCNCNFLSSVSPKKSTYGITRVNKDKFATCGGDRVFLWTVHGDFVWTVGGERIISEDEVYDVDHKAHGIHYNGTYYCVLHRDYDAVTILDGEGRKIRKIVKKGAFGKNIKFGLKIHMDSDTNNLFIPCILENPCVLCLSVEGESLWFTPLSGARLWKITEIEGSLCIVDLDNQCLHLMSKRGQYIRQLETGTLVAEPMCIDYDERKRTLYISCSSLSHHRDIITVFSLQSYS